MIRLVLLFVPLAMVIAQGDPRAVSDMLQLAGNDGRQLVVIERDGPVVGEEWDGICPTCKAQRLTSRVTCDGSTMCTSLWCGAGYYDEQGRYHPAEDCNSCSTTCTCTNGHTMVRATRTP